LIANAVSRYTELPEFGGQARGPGMFSLCDVDETVSLLLTAGFEQVESHVPLPSSLEEAEPSKTRSTSFSAWVWRAASSVSSSQVRGVM
jgi:hypothetical protein